MINVQDNTYTPSIEEISDYIHNSLFDDLCQHMQENYKITPKIEFSKCSWEYGWNVKFKKSSKSLCTVYPRENYFTALVVVGNKEKEAAEDFFLTCSSSLPEIYHETKEGNGQRWLMIDLEDDGALYNEVLALIDIRRKST